MQWIEASFRTHSQDIDALCEKLTELGADGLVIEDEADFRRFLEENRQYWDYVDEELEARYRGVSRVKLYVEDEAFLTDLFPLSLNQGKYNALFYQEDSALQEYLALKGEKKAALAQGTYGQARRDIAWRYGRLLSYTEEGIQRLLESNTEKEKIPSQKEGIPHVHEV